MTHSSSPAEPQTTMQQHNAAKIYVLLAIVVCIKAVLQLSTIELLISVRSVSSPLAYFWLSQDPVLADINWPAGSLDFRFSTLMQGLAQLWQTGLFSDVGFLRAFGAVSILFQAAGVAVLAHALFRNPLAVFAITSVFIISPLGGINFGNFGAGLGRQIPVLFYSIADGFSFLAIALVLQRRYLLSALFLAAAMHSHVTLGFYASLFAFGMVLVRPADFRTRQLWGAFALVAVLAAPLALRLIESGGIDVSQINTDDWVLMSRMVNFHWHPIQLGLFDTISHVVLVPFTLLLLGWYAVQPLLPHAFKELQPQLICACVLMGIVSAAGIIFSDIWHVPTVMKAAPMRASMYISLIALFALIGGLTVAIRNGRPLSTALAVFILAGFFVAAPGIGLIPLLALAATVRPAGWVRQTLWTMLAVFSAAAAALHLGWLAPELFAGWPGPLRNLLPVTAIDFSVLGWSPRFDGALWSTALLAAVAGGLLPRARRAALPMMLCLTAVGSLAVAATDRSTWLARHGEQAASFRAAQLWARENTDPHAIFMGDPTRDNGWREFSQRAWFGSGRDVTHFATLYDSSRDRFDAGIERLTIFGPDPRSIDAAEVDAFKGGKYFTSVLNKAYKSGYLALSAADLARVQRRFGVSYLIANTAEIPQGLKDARPVYENTHFAIFHLPRGNAQ